MPGPGTPLMQAAMRAGSAANRPFAFLGSALVGLFDAENYASISEASGLVSSWTDSITAAQLSQGVSAAKPVYDATGFNGRAAITFDGVDDFVALITAPATWPIANAASVIYALVQQDRAAGVAGVNSVIAYGGSSNGTNRRLVRNVASGINIASSNDVTTNANSTAEFSGIKLARAAAGAGSFNIQLDGSAPGVTATGTTNTLAARVRIGASAAGTASSFWLGKINSILIINPTHSSWTAAAEEALVALLKSRGGIA